jgi:hypothetical protein
MGDNGKGAAVRHLGGDIVHDLGPGIWLRGPYNIKAWRGKGASVSSMAAW